MLAPHAHALTPRSREWDCVLEKDSHKKPPVVWGAAPKKSTKNAICATSRRRIVNDSSSLYRTRRASYISIFSPSNIRRKTITTADKNSLYDNGIESSSAWYFRGVYRARRPLDAHTRTGTEITIAFLTEKDGQMAEKRRKKWRPFCFAHLRGVRGELYVCSFFEKKTQPKQMHVAGCYDRTREKFSRPLRDAVRGAIFFHTPFSYEKMCSVALLSSGLARRVGTRCFTFDFWRLKSSVGFVVTTTALEFFDWKYWIEKYVSGYSFF